MITLAGPESDPHKWLPTYTLMFTHVFYVYVQRQQHTDKTSSKTSTLDLGQDFSMSFFLSAKQNNNTSNNSDGSFLQRRH